MPAVVHLQNVTKTFGSKKALDNVSLSVQKGQVFGFLGPNGAGKTTTIRCLMDYIRPTSGSVRILGKDSQQDSASLKNSIGFLSAETQLYQNWTSKTHIDFVANIKGHGRADELVKQLDLDTSIKVQNLSSGNKQKLAVVLAFMGSPKLLIMDEPTRSLDPLLQNQLYGMVRDFAKTGGTVFFSSHNLSEVQQLCDNVSVIRAGTIVAAEAMQDILQTKVHMVQAVTKTAITLGSLPKGGIEVISHQGKAIRLKVKTDLNPVIAILAKHTITDLEVTHVNLEDVFMEYYQDV